MYMSGYGRVAAKGKKKAKKAPKKKAKAAPKKKAAKGKASARKKKS